MLVPLGAALALCLLPEVGAVLFLAVVTGHERHARLFHQALRGRFVPHRGNRLRARPDEDELGAPAGLRERRVLGEGAVTWVDRLRGGIAVRGEHRTAVIVHYGPGR